MNNCLGAQWGACIICNSLFEVMKKVNVTFRDNVLSLHPTRWKWQEKIALPEQFWQGCGAPSRGVWLANSTFGEYAFELLSAQKILCYALALLKLRQDDSDVSLSGWLLGFDRQSTVKTFQDNITWMTVVMKLTSFPNDKKTIRKVF